MPSSSPAALSFSAISGHSFRKLFQKLFVLIFGFFLLAVASKVHEIDAEISGFPALLVLDHGDLALAVELVVPIRLLVGVQMRLRTHKSVERFIAVIARIGRKGIRLGD